ncbi:MAG: hypothetical protein ACYTFA_10775, partial [Planctomycetota bacterium]
MILPLILFGSMVWSGSPCTVTTTYTSKKLFAEPVGANGGRSRVPGVMLTSSAISPHEGMVGFRPTSTRPSDGLRP